MIKYVGSVSLNYFVLSHSKISQKLIYVILLGPSQNSSKHIRIPAEKD